MNYQRRQEIDAVIASLKEAKLRLSYIRNRERADIDNMPEERKDSWKYEDMEYAAYKLECAIEGIEDCIDDAYDAKG